MLTLEQFVAITGLLFAAFKKKIAIRIVNHSIFSVKVMNIC